MNTAEKLTGACASCMEPASAVVVPVLCGSSASGTAPTPRRAPAAFCRIPTHHGRNPLPGAACALAPLVGRAARPQCAHGNFWASSDHVVWHPSRLCHLTRFRGGVTSRFPAARLPLLGQAGFSERILLTSFPGWVSLLPLFCLACSPSRQFDWIFRTPLPSSA